LHSLTSLKGEKGDPGEQGPKGDTGAAGSQGEKGDKGDAGRGIDHMEIIDDELWVYYTGWHRTESGEYFYRRSSGRR